MHNDSNAILDDLLARWHHHCKSYSPVPVAGCDPMFRGAKSSRHWDSFADIADDAVNTAQMKAIDFHVGEMQEPYRAAIYITARNCYTGHGVWLSPRLPADKEEREIVILEARNIITRKLMSAGAM
jgi:hypothetical protein